MLLDFGTPGSLGIGISLGLMVFAAEECRADNFTDEDALSGFGIDFSAMGFGEDGFGVAGFGEAGFGEADLAFDDFSETDFSETDLAFDVFF